MSACEISGDLVKSLLSSNSFPCIENGSVDKWWQLTFPRIDSSQQTFQRRFNVAFRLIWRRDVAQHQIKVETTLCTSTLKFTTFNNVETTLYISTLNWTTLDNVETRLSSSTSIFTTLDNVETTLRIWPFRKKNKHWFKNKIIFLSFKESKSSFFPHFKRNL